MMSVMGLKIAAGLILAAAAIATVLPRQGPWVERHYARGAFPGIQRVLTGASNAVPFALLDVVIAGSVVLAALAIASVVRAPAGGRLAMAGHRGWQAVALVSLAYLVFLAAWGLNYRREPVSAWLDFDNHRVTSEAVASLNEAALGELARLRPGLPIRDTDWPGRELAARRLVPAVNETVRLLGLPTPVVPGRPKTTILDPFLTRAGVSGLTNPFLLETLLPSNLLGFEYPSVIAHEWGHLAGLARESDASFFGLMACLRGDAGAQYSAWLDIFLQTLPGSAGGRRAAAIARLPAAVRTDIDAMAARTSRDRVGTISRASWRVYDRYLRSNRVDSGLRNYGEVVRLLAGTRFDPGWRPVLGAGR
jgi:hypothetical protein